MQCDRRHQTPFDISDGSGHERSHDRGYRMASLVLQRVDGFTSRVLELRNDHQIVERVLWMPGMIAEVHRRQPAAPPAPPLQAPRHRCPARRTDPPANLPAPDAQGREEQVEGPSHESLPGIVRQHEAVYHLEIRDADPALLQCVYHRVSTVVDRKLPHDRAEMVLDRLLADAQSLCDGAVG